MLKHIYLRNFNSGARRIPLLDLLSVLQDLENVELLELDFAQRDDVVDEQEAPAQCRLPNLQILNLKCFCPRMISLFRVPSLRTLILTVPQGHLSLIAPLSKMIKASLCVVTVFHCYELREAPWVLFDRPTRFPDYLTWRQEHLLRVAKFLAKYMPRVEIVKGFTMMLDAKLMLRMAAGLALPRLQEISCFLPPSHVDLLLDVLEARAEGRGHGGKLWKIFVAINGPMSEHTKARLNTVVKDLGITFEKKEFCLHTLEVVIV
ncbi:hypothetical protein C0993_003350 [Termitomyces sp. T159_Od127]|nr:hypothetical protein C0993_003350 [Termitomyces sp. T159_Od127]